MQAQYLQLARDGRWEEALRLDLPASKTLLQNWLVNASEDLALELFFGEADFVGLRLKPFQHEAQLLRFCDNPTIEALREIFAAPELFRGQADFAELGVVNAWQSLGSKILWRQGEAIPTVAMLDSLLLNSPLWLQSKAISLEFAYLSPIPHWRAFSVSSYREQVYHLDLALVQAALQQLEDNG